MWSHNKSKSTLTTHLVPHFFQPAGKSGPREGALYAWSINPVTVCPLCVRMAGRW